MRPVASRRYQALALMPMSRSVEDATGTPSGPVTRPSNTA